MSDSSILLGPRDVHVVLPFGSLHSIESVTGTSAVMRACSFCKIVRWRKKMEQSMKEQDKPSADEENFVCNGRLVCCHEMLI